MKNENIEQLFERLKGDFDQFETPEGHQKRFAERLNRSKGSQSGGWEWWKPLSVAASILVIFGVAFTLGSRTAQPDGLASVSPEMAETQSYFLATISTELNRLDSFRSPETELLIEDAIKQLDRLELEYQKLKEDLIKSGHDKRVISAMIQNFQSRIDLLEHVLAMAEEMQNLKFNQNEITI